MVSRKSKKKSEEEKTSGSASITSFLYGTGEQQAKTSAETNQPRQNQLKQERKRQRRRNHAQRAWLKSIPNRR